MHATKPRIGLAKLGRLRGYERLFHVAWGIVRWATLAAVLVAIATYIDWRVDKDRETPFALRAALSGFQGFLLAIAGLFWLLLPWARGPSLIKLARRIEDGVPEFGHRLVTSIQLTRKGATTGGMSPELIAIVANESEEISGRHRFSKFADTRRLKWAVGLLAVPLLVIAGATGFYGADLFKILVQRQLLAAAEIPRFHQVENVTPVLWPAGDEVVVEYAVAGRIADDAVGTLRVMPDGLSSDEYPLTLARTLDDGRSVFAVTVPHSSVNFAHRAWIGDGRSKTSSDVRFEPRPVVTRTDAWVRLPPFLGAKPDGRAYETYQSQGEITGLAGSTARVKIAVQKPTSEANLILLARTRDGKGEAERAPLPMSQGEPETLLSGEVQHPAEVSFDLTPDLLAYRIEVKDRNGFANSTPPRRGIRIAPDEPPVVRLLAERYAELGSAPSDEDIIEGLPVPLGGQIPIAYTCHSPQGVLKAQLRYRVNEKGPWIRFDLRVVDADTKTGPFDPTRGAFAHTQYGQQVEFHAMPAADRESTPDYLQGGGRFDFQTAELTKMSEGGASTKLEVGDRVEYYVEVFDRNPGTNRPAGRSEARIKEVLTAGEVLSRLDQTRQAEGKIRDLEKKQRDVFVSPAKSPPGPAD